eukprot:1187868-Prorocentrum_minimum.AAC.1
MSSSAVVGKPSSTCWHRSLRSSSGANASTPAGACGEWSTKNEPILQGSSCANNGKGAAEGAVSAVFCSTVLHCTVPVRRAPRALFHCVLFHCAALYCTCP